MTALLVFSLIVSLAVYGISFRLKIARRTILACMTFLIPWLVLMTWAFFVGDRAIPGSVLYNPTSEQAH